MLAIKPSLALHPVPVGAINLPVDVAGIEEKDLVGARRLLLAPIQKPERHR